MLFRFEKVLEHDELLAQALALKGLGDLRKAKRKLYQALKLFPKSQAARVLLKRIQQMEQVKV